VSNAESALRNAGALDADREAGAMSTKKAAKTTPTAVLDTADRPEKIRNVALVGHSGSGKTTLVAAGGNRHDHPRRNDLRGQHGQRP